MHNKDVSSDNEIEKPCTNNAESGMRKGITGIGSPGRHCSQCSGLMTENLRELRTETASCPIDSRSPSLNDVPRRGNLIDQVAWTCKNLWGEKKLHCIRPVLLALELELFPPRH